VETVGVGQSEYEVASMVDLFMVLMVPNAGDELQGIKKGIIELADLLVINKADGDTKILAENAKTTYENALHIIKKERFWSPQVLTCSSLEKTGFQEIMSTISSFEAEAKKSDWIKENRQKQAQHWLNSLFKKELLNLSSANESLKEAFEDIHKMVLDKKLTAREGALKMIESLKGNL
jgi:LAO/AO transport system kinase